MIDRARCPRSSYRGTPDHIAGFGRIKREDFYAGNLENIEVVATVNGKSMYYTFPIRPGVWLVSASLEAIQPKAGEVVDYAQEAFIVSDDGALVTGAFAYDQPSVTLGTLYASGKVSFPAHYYDALDHKGMTMTNMPWGEHRSSLMVPVSQGISPSTHRMGHMFGTGATTLPNNLPLQFETAAGTDTPVLRMTAADELVLSHEGVDFAMRPEVVTRADGRFQIKQGGTEVASVVDKKLTVFNKLWLAPNGVAVLAGNGDPNTKQTAVVGSVYVNWSTGINLWVKAVGTGDTGWVPAGVYSGTTGTRPAAPPHRPVLLGHHPEQGDLVGRDRVGGCHGYRRLARSGGGHRRVAPTGFVPGTGRFLMCR